MAISGSFEKSPPGVKYQWGEVGGARVITDFDFYGQRVKVDTGQLSPAGTLISVWLATGTPVSDILERAGGSKTRVIQQINSVHYALDTPPRRLHRAVLAVSRLCLSGSIFRPSGLSAEGPGTYELPVVNDKARKALTMHGRDASWEFTGSSTGFYERRDLYEYLGAHNPDSKLVQAKDPVQLMMYACCAGLVDPAEIVACQATPPPSLPLPAVYSPLPILPNQRV